MSRLTRTLLACGLALGTLLAPGVSGATVEGLPSWDTVKTLDPSSGNVALHGVLALAKNDVWTVGERGFGSNRTLIEHWNGSAFSVFPSPSIREKWANFLDGVDGSSANDVWAVGHADISGFTGSRSLILHWKGAAWKRVQSPNHDGPYARNDLFGVAAISTTDAWAVGMHTKPGTPGSTAITFHYDGTSWTSSPNSCGPTLEGVSALSSTKVWAVGGNSSCAWDGTTWTSYPAANAPNGNDAIDLLDVDGAAAGNLWAVGNLARNCGPGLTCYSGVIEHWDGTAWSFVEKVGQTLYGVKALSPSNVYAVGLGSNTPIILHFDGVNWAPVPSPTPAIAGRLDDVDASGAKNLWAVGQRFGLHRSKTLAERAPSPTSGAFVGKTNAAGATVSWIGRESNSVKADGSGHYGAAGLPYGYYGIKATHAGCNPAQKNVIVPAGTTIRVDLHLTC